MMLAVANVSCSKSDGAGEAGGGAAANPDGWELAFLNGSTAIAGHVYLELSDRSFTLYQQIGDLMTSGFKSYTGSCTFASDPELGVVLSGVYSDGTPWARRYLVESYTDSELRLRSIDEEFVSVYRRAEIPAYVREKAVAIPSRGGDGVPFL